MVKFHRKHVLVPIILLCFFLSLQAKYPGLLSRTRGLGIMGSVDFPTVDQRNKAISKLLAKGKYISSISVGH